MRKKTKNNQAAVRIFKNCFGFTLIELMFVLFILGVIIAIALPMYFRYLDKARVTVAFAALDSMQKELETFHLDYGKYPSDIDFSSCVDGEGKRVFSPDFCNQMKKDLFSIDSYAISSPSYTLTAKATDSDRTLLTLTAAKISKN